jgi:hypothetical protein
MNDDQPRAENFTQPASFCGITPKGMPEPHSQGNT